MITLDISVGDILIVGNTEYPIRSISDWTMKNRGGSMRLLANVFASTKRSPAIVDGKRGAPTFNLTNLYCTPLDPLDSETRRRIAIDTPHELKQTTIVSDNNFLHLVVEDLRV